MQAGLNKETATNQKAFGGNTLLGLSVTSVYESITLLIAKAVMMSDSLWMMRAFPPGDPRFDSDCTHRLNHYS